MSSLCCPYLGLLRHYVAAVRRYVADISTSFVAICYYVAAILTLRWHDFVAICRHFVDIWAPFAGIHRYYHLVLLCAAIRRYFVKFKSPGTAIYLSDFGATVSRP